MAGPPGRPRQVAITDELWDVYSALAEESGMDVDVLINQGMFEMAVRLGYITPVPADVAPPAGEDEFEAPPPPRPSRPPKPAPQKFAQGRTREAGSRSSSGGGGGGGGGKRPPRPAPRPPKEAPAPQKKGLFIVNEDGDTEKIDKDIYIIGRSSKCDLVINSVKVSREHAIITRERGDYFIEDLGSANGTWYKGERIEKMKIRDGDEIFICDEKFKFVVR